MKIGRKLTKAGLVLCILSMLLQLLGYTCPGWAVTRIYLHVISTVLGSGISGYGELGTSVAVWYGRVCLTSSYQEESCSLSTDHDARLYGYRVTYALWPLADIDWTKVRILLTLALFMGCIGVFLAIASLLKDLKVTHRLLTVGAAACMLASGILVVPAVIEVAIANIAADEAVSTQNKAIGYEMNEVFTPWALILSGLGVIAALAGAVLLAVASIAEKKKKSMMVTPESTEVLFNIQLAKEKAMSDSSFGTNIINQGPAAIPRIGDPDTEELHFENYPFRPVQFSSFRAPNTDSNGQANSATVQSGDEKEASKDKPKHTRKLSERRRSSKVFKHKVDKNHAGIRRNRPTDTANSYYNTLITEGVPASRHMQPGPRRRSKAGLGSRSSRDIANNTTGVPAITVTPIKDIKVDDKLTDDTGRLKFNEPKVMDTQALYSQKLTHVNTGHDKRKGTSPEPDRPECIPRDEMSW